MTFRPFDSEKALEPMGHGPNGQHTGHPRVGTGTAPMELEKALIQISLKSDIARGRKAISNSELDLKGMNILQYKYRNCSNIVGRTAIITC